MNPRGFCECGCGRKTKLALRDRKDSGWVKGEPIRFIHGHATSRTGKNNPNWKSGRKNRSDGYVLVHAPKHPQACYRYIMEHRLVMERLLGRNLFPEERVHHINGKRNDNRPENLELWSLSHPNGQRITDLVVWAKEILKKY